MTLHELTMKAYAAQSRDDVAAVARCMKRYIRGLRKPREDAIYDRELRRAFKVIADDTYHKAVLALLVQDDIGYGVNGLSNRATAGRWWIR